MQKGSFGCFLLDCLNKNFRMLIIDANIERIYFR